MPKVYGLGRASTDKQVITPEAQHDRIKTFCVFQIEMKSWDDTYEWIGFFCDKAVSGSVPLRMREYGNYVFTHAEAGDVIIAADFDRCFRDTVDFLETAADLRARKIALVLLDIGRTPIDTSDPSQEAMLTCMAAFKTYERKNIAKRINDAFDRVRKTRGMIRPRTGWLLKASYPGSKEKIAVPDVPIRKLGAWLVAEKAKGRNLRELWRELFYDPKTRKINGRDVTWSLVTNVYWSATHGWPKTGISRAREGYVQRRRGPCLAITDS